MAERKRRAPSGPRIGGARDTVDGRIVLHRRVDARSVMFDPQTFQFKSGGDQHGVTDRLQGVRAWNPLAAGKTMVYEYADGRRVIADGHQRTGLAKRLMAEGHKPIKLNAFVMQERFGWQPSDVRVYAAIKNMQESSGNAVDMAKVMRERPDLVNRAALPITDTKLREAKALARLSPGAFNMVVGGAIKPEVAAAVGETIRDTSRHADMLKELARDKVASGQHARLYVQQALAAPSLTETTTSLFGKETTTRSLLRERAAVLDRALNQLKGDKRLFGMLTREAGAIEGVGNKLQHGVNAQLSTSAGQMAHLVEKLATTRGPVSTMLDDAARAMADGDSASKAARQFVSGLRATAKSGGMMALAGTSSPTAAAALAAPVAAAAEESVAASATRLGQRAMFGLTPLAAVAAGAIAYDSSRNRAMASGVSKREGEITAAATGATAAAVTLGVALGVAKAVSYAAGKVAKVAPKAAPYIKPGLLAVGGLALAAGAYRGWKQTGSGKGAALGAVSGGEVFEVMKKRQYRRVYRTGDKAGMIEIVHRSR